MANLVLITIPDDRALLTQQGQGNAEQQYVSIANYLADRDVPIDNTFISDDPFAKDAMKHFFDTNSSGKTRISNAKSLIYPPLCSIFVGIDDRSPPIRFLSEKACGRYLSIGAYAIMKRLTESDSDAPQEPKTTLLMASDPMVKAIVNMLTDQALPESVSESVSGFADVFYFSSEGEGLPDLSVDMMELVDVKSASMLINNTGYQLDTAQEQTYKNEIFLS